MINEDLFFSQLEKTYLDAFLSRADKPTSYTDEDNINHYIEVCTTLATKHGLTWEEIGAECMFRYDNEADNTSNYWDDEIDPAGGHGLQSHE